MVDNESMNIGSISSFEGLAGMATNLRAGDVGMQISAAVLKQALDTQKQQAQALVDMIQSSAPPSPDGAGRILDIRV
jgi:hypothetical protein